MLLLRGSWCAIESTSDEKDDFNVCEYFIFLAFIPGGENSANQFNRVFRDKEIDQDKKKYIKGSELEIGDIFVSGLGTAPGDLATALSDVAR